MSFLTSIGLYSQDISDKVFYVYRNDGGFNAFYCSEVDSITYSCLDNDSIKHKKVVTQELWTADSIYRIPIHVIDSVSFIKPTTSYKANVIKIDEKYIPYIISADSLSITFSPNLPQKLIPQKDDILLYEGFCGFFPDGFAGRVYSVSDEIIVKCDSVEFEDVYDELILFGDYILTEENQNSRPYRLVPQRIAGELPLTIAIPVKQSFGSITLQGSATLGIRLRTVVRLRKEMAPYFEMQVKDEESLNLEITADADSSKFKQIGDKLFGVDVPIPGCPLLRFNYAASPFSKSELKAYVSFGFEMNSKGQTSYVFDGNNWKTIQTPRACEQKFTVKTGLEGSFWCGIVECFHLSTIKSFLSVGADMYYGPKISGNVDINLMDGINTSSIYETLKDTKVDISMRFESDMTFRWRLSKKNSRYIPLFNIIPSIEWHMDERYLFPLFTKPVCTAANTNVNVSSEVSRTLLLPCSVGYRLSSCGETIDTYYNDKTYWLDDDFSAPLTTTFTGLKYTYEKYKVCPMVKLLGWEVEATPTAEFIHGLYVCTGDAFASFTEARCWGRCSFDEDFNKKTDIMSVADECGFFYNQIGEPQNGNALKQVCSMTAKGLFDGTLSGLTEDTQYFYTAYIKNGEDYYYGDVRTFKTKSQENPDIGPIPDPAPGPNPLPDSIPLAITGTHYNETSTTATIECRYENIPAGAECGYYLYGWKGNAVVFSTSSSFENMEGDKTFDLTGLKPSTTYYYQAYVYYKGKEYSGEEKSFQTLTPNAVTGGYSNVTSNKATIICAYYNVPSGATTGIKLSYNGQTDEMPYSYGDGEHSIDILNLCPSTTYTYSAYIKYEDDYYEGGDKQFTTLTPSAYVGEAIDIGEETVQFEYGFSNVPQDANCYIAIQAENEENYYCYSVSETERDTYGFSGLQPSTTYTYWAFVELVGLYWNSNSERFTTKARPKPSAITGECLEVTENSAVVKCSYNNAQNLSCGVTVIGGGDTLSVATDSSDGEREISITGLSPATTYTYYAYVVDVDGITYFGEDKTFTTEPKPLPDLSGIWIFDQGYYGNHSLTIELILESKTKQSATYNAKSGFYGANHLSVTVNSDGSGSIGCWNSAGYTGSFSGTFNDSYTVLSGDRFYYGTNSWANPGWWVEESWSLHR